MYYTLAEILIEAGNEIERAVNEKKEVIICKVKKGRPVEDSFGIWTEEKSGIEYVNGIRDEAEQRLEEKGIEKPFFKKESFTKETLSFICNE